MTDPNWPKCSICGWAGWEDGDHEHDTCFMCGAIAPGGTGQWAMGLEDNVTVCRGPCWRQYEKLRAIEKGLLKIARKAV